MTVTLCPSFQMERRNGKEWGETDVLTLFIESETKFFELLIRDVWDVPT